MCRESNMEIYNTVCKIANGNLLMTQGAQTGALGLSRRVGWGGRWEGTWVALWLSLVDD